ncbi:MAG: hypothetical protein H3Z50_08265, partial [archaeon]|nr:hypothetical protein [archaeon]
HIGKIKFDRRGTSYCRPLAYQDNLVEMWNLYKAKKYRGMLAKLSRTWPKYNSMYLNFGFGTMELRMFNASIESAVLIKWINITTDFIANAVDLPVKTGSPNPDEYQETLHKLFPNTYAEIAPHASFEDVKHIEEVIPVNPKLTDSTLRAFKKHLVKDEPKATMPPPSVLKPKTYTVATPVSASQLEYQEWLSTANQLNEELTPLNSNIVTDLNQLINTLTSPSDPIFSEEN